MKRLYTGSYLHVEPKKSEWRIVAVGRSPDTVMREARLALRDHLSEKGTVNEEMIVALVDNIGVRTRLSVVKYIEPSKRDHVPKDTDSVYNQCDDEIALIDSLNQ